MLALIAGTGALPGAVLERLETQPFIAALYGFEPEVTPDLTFRLETLGTFLHILRQKGVTEICMAGAVRRPEIDLDLIDERTKPLVPQIMQALGSGDDGALRAVIAVFEEAGFAVRGVHELVPDLLPPAGVLTAARPEPSAHADAVAGEKCLIKMAAIDLGQACIVRRGEVLAREGDAGTDAMLRRFAPVDVHRPFVESSPLTILIDSASDVVAQTADWLSGGQSAGARGAILFKGPKPGQERRADLPVIGPMTAVAACEARLAGIVIEAEGVMVLDREAVVATLDAFGLFLWVRPRGGG